METNVYLTPKKLDCVVVRCPQTFDKFVSTAYILPPIGPAYVAASIRAAGHRARVVDATGGAIDRFTPLEADPRVLRRGLSDDEIVDQVGAADVVGFSLMFSQDWLEARELIARTRERLPDAVLVAGGEHFTADPKGALDTSELDFVLTGEGDRSICELLEHVRGLRPIEEVHSCWYRTPDGEARVTDTAARIRDIDTLPWPAWDLVPVEAYLAGNHMGAVDRGRSLPINATRGCPFQCTFCSSPSMWTTKYVTRTPHEVLDEMRAHIEAYDIANFEFVDLTAIVRKSWAMEFAQLIIDADLGITWQLPSGTRSEALDSEVLELLVRSGCLNISYAPESGDPETLELVKKRVKLDRMLVSMREAVDAGCNVKANMIFGFPNETRWSLLRSFGFLARMAAAGVHDISIAPLKAYPGSELFRSLQADGTIPETLDDSYYRSLVLGVETVPFSTDPAPSYSPNLTAGQLDRLRIAAMAWFFGVSWLLHPSRPFRLIANLRTGRQESRLDKSLAELKKRRTQKAENRLVPAARRVNPF